MGEGLRAFIKKLRKSGGQAWRTCPFFCLKSEEGGSILPRGGVKQRKGTHIAEEGGGDLDKYKYIQIEIYGYIQKYIQTARNSVKSTSVGIYLDRNRHKYMDICRNMQMQTDRDIDLDRDILVYIGTLLEVKKSGLRPNKELRTPKYMLGTYRRDFRQYNEYSIKHISTKDFLLVREPLSAYNFF